MPANRRPRYGQLPSSRSAWRGVTRAETLQRSKRHWTAIDRLDAVAKPGQQATPTGQIEHLAMLLDQARKTAHPGRWGRFMDERGLGEKKLP
jgi:hypothetical protein